MKLNKINVLITAIASMLGSILLAAGPRSANVAIELSIFMAKCGFALLMLFSCMEKEGEE